MEVLVLERAAAGGQAGITEKLDNLPGFPDGISGGEFADRLRRQAERFGVEVVTAVDVTEIAVDPSCSEPSTAMKLVRTAAGEEYRSYAVLLALGSTYRRLGIDGEEDFIGAGVHFCATCDGPFYRDQKVLVVGGGNSAGEESLFLTRFAREVVVATRGADLTASRTVAEKVYGHSQITVRGNTSPVAFKGRPGEDGGKLATVVLEGPDGWTEESFDGVFVFIGLLPNTDVVKDLIELDRYGFAVTDGMLATSVPGVFAAGDVRQGSTLPIRRYVEPLAGGVPDRMDVEAVVAT
jgi:thioredoxin reductase (NADPH)